MGCVYRHTAPDGRMYIGITCSDDPTVRWAKGKGYKDNPEFWKCICEVGWDNMRHEILESNVHPWLLRELESKLIGKYNTLAPNGFNRRRDMLDSSERQRLRKKEVGLKYGKSTVYDYWPDSEGYKVYKLQCECGRFFVRHGWDIDGDNVCEECEIVKKK